MTRQGWTLTRKITLPFIIFGMTTIGLGWAGAPPGTADPGTPAKPSFGQVVSHEVDVVVEHVYSSRESMPKEPPTEPLPRADVETGLAGLARWWSDNTGLKFEFTLARMTATNTTCPDYYPDAFAALGQPYDFTIYPQSRRDLVIIMDGGSCSDRPAHAIQADTVDVFTGGHMVFSGLWNFNSPATLAHEFGHTIGLGHANGMNCRNVTVFDDQVGPSWDGYTQVGPSWDGWQGQPSWEGNVPAGCKYLEYGDASSIMGSYTLGGNTSASTLGSIDRWSLGVGWDDLAVVDKPVTQQVLTLARYDPGKPITPDPSGNPRGVVVSTPDGGFLGSLEFRDPSFGFFTQPGVYLSFGSPPPDVRNWTFQADPAGLAPVQESSGESPPRVPLDPGFTYVSRDGTVRLRTLSVNETTARVEVTMTAQTGIQGMVSITRTGGTLAAVVTGAPASATTSYQWFRNGQPIPGATQAAYTPYLPDANAVYRVEATLQAAGHAATTRYSRGIIPDDHRLSVTGTDISVTLLNQNGGPVDCAGMNLMLDIKTAAGDDVAGRNVRLEPTTVAGVCRTPIGVPLSGSLSITATNPLRQDASHMWQTAYWQAQTTSATIRATQATAALAIGIPARIPYSGQSEYDTSVTPPTPVLTVDNGNPALPVTVSVTDATGAPAAGVPVKLGVDVPGFVLADTEPVTDQYGFAHTTLDWDHFVQAPNGYLAAHVSAAVEGIATVTGAPAQVGAKYAFTPQVAGWFEGKTSLLADGQDAARLHLRAWTGYGDPIVNQADKLTVSLLNISGLLSRLQDVSMTSPVWDPADQSYVVSVTSKSAQTVGFFVLLGISTVQYIAPVEFRAEPASVQKTVTLSLSGDSLEVRKQPCNGPVDVVPASVTATATVTDQAGRPVTGAVVAWSADSPLLTGVPTGVTGADGKTQVAITLDGTRWSDDMTRLTLTATTDGTTTSAVISAGRSVEAQPWTWWTMTVAPTSVDPVPADGVSSWTVTVHTVDQCGLPVPYQLVQFQVTGIEVPTSAKPQSPSAVSDINGWARMTVTDTTPEKVIVSARGMYGAGPLRYMWQPIGFVGPPVAVPVIAVANGSVVSGTAVAGPGQCEAVSVQVTYPSTRGPLTIETAVTGGRWSVALPDDAVGGVVTAVARDARDNPSDQVSAPLDVTAPSAPLISRPMALVPPDRPVAGRGSEPGNTVTVLDGATVVCRATVGTDYRWSCAATPLANGLHTLTATETDAAGNVSARSPGVPLAVVTQASGKWWFY